MSRLSSPTPSSRTGPLSAAVSKNWSSSKRTLVTGRTRVIAETVPWSPSSANSDEGSLSVQRDRGPRLPCRRELADDFAVRVEKRETRRPVGRDLQDDSRSSVAVHQRDA